jgi:hypothetical protein
MAATNALPPQPGGFEGLVKLRGYQHSPQASIAERPAPTCPDYHLNPVAPQERAGLASDDMLVCLDELLDLDPHGLPVLYELPPVALHLIGPLVDSASLADVRGGVPFDIGSGVLQGLVPGPAVPRVHGCADLLDVLLRHRPRGISLRPVDGRSRLRDTVAGGSFRRETDRMMRRQRSRVRRRNDVAARGDA